MRTYDPALFLAWLYLSIPCAVGTHRAQTEHSRKKCCGCAIALYTEIALCLKGVALSDGGYPIPAAPCARTLRMPPCLCTIPSTITSRLLRMAR